jgi:dipeptidyl aminopeptidase/acylaminoacyl peptidase
MSRGQYTDAFESDLKPLLLERTAKMTAHGRKLVAVAIPLVFLFAAARSFGQDQAGSSQDVEKRLKAAEKPESVKPFDGVVKTLFAAHRFEQVVISPDGSKVSWVETLVDKDGTPTGNTAIRLKDLNHTAAPARRISAGGALSAHAEGNVAWSPDSKKIAFLSDVAKKGQLQLYVVSAAGGPAKKLTGVRGFLAAPGWSPDGKTIAVLFTENATRASGPLVAETPETGEIKDAFFEQRLALVDLATGTLRQISPADTYVYEYHWSPDGTRFAVTAAPGNGDNNWWVAELYTLDAATGLMKSIYKPKLQISNPAWSPDGKQIAWIEGLMSDEGITGGDIFTLPGDGGEAKNVTSGRKASVAWLGWQPDGSKILFSEFVGGNSAIATLEPATGKIEERWSAEGAFTAGGIFSFTLSAASDGQTVAGVFESFAHAPEVVVLTGAPAALRPLTSINADLKPAWGEAKSITWKNDGHEIQGWLLYPRDFDPAKKYPLVTHVHGGPSSLALSHWPGVHDFSAGLSGMGYFVLYPNPRGSYGQGESFTRANVRDFGYGDFKDILAGVEQALRVAPIDANRLGITGWSYGGYMTMWAVTQTNRFKAAVAGAGIANYQSYYGENSIDQWMIPFFGKSVYEDPEVYAKSSPITFIQKAKTPTLILVGDSDGECPTPQSYEFWHALKTLGVETQFVVYEREGHLFANPAHQRDVIERTLSWFDLHLR